MGLNQGAGEKARYLSQRLQSCVQQVQCQDRLLCRAALIFYEFLIKFRQDISLSPIRLVDVID